MGQIIFLCLQSRCFEPMYTYTGMMLCISSSFLAHTIHAPPTTKYGGAATVKIS